MHIPIHATEDSGIVKIKEKKLLVFDNNSTNVLLVEMTLFHWS